MDATINGDLLEVLMDLTNIANRDISEDIELEVQVCVQAADILVSVLEQEMQETNPAPIEDQNTFATGDEILDCLSNIVELAEITAAVNGSPADYIRMHCRRKRWGVHPINQLRREQGHFDNLLKEMRRDDHDKFFNFTRMSPTQFDDLLALIAPHITKMSSNAISPECRLLITLRFLASGDSFQSLHYNFRVGASTARQIVIETSSVLWDILGPIYLKYPDKEKWKQSAAGFGELGLPNCCGAVDGKHIHIQAPANSGSMYYNYLKSFSIVLLAICDANKNFLYVDIGAYGGQSDGGVLSNSSFGKRLEADDLNFPRPAPLPGTNEGFPYFIIGDAAFPLKKRIQKPYGGRNLNEVQANYNTTFNSVRKVIENAFGIVAKRWRLFMKPIEGDPSNIDVFIKAAVVLHNFIKSYNDKNTERYLAVEDEEWNMNFANIQLNVRNSTAHASALRDKYAAYLFIKTT